MSEGTNTLSHSSGSSKNVPKLPPLPTQALRLLKTTRRVPKVTALGGGHGLYGSLSALRHVTTDVTAIVTVADDGGSSGRLRNEMGVLPPGDLRMALSALCDDTDWGRTWSDVLQHRFSAPEGHTGEFPLDYHALGNLLIVTLWELLGDPVAGLDWVGALLNARGRVLPMALEPLVIQGIVLREHGGAFERVQVRGQVNLAHEPQVHNIELVPAQAHACPEALVSIEEADWVVLGPGSWRTSVLPHLLLREQREALSTTNAKRCVVMNLALDDKESNGLDAAAHLKLLQQYAPNLRLDVVIADPSNMGVQSEFEDAARELGAKVLWASVRSTTNPNVHDPLKLASAYNDMFAMRL